MAHPSAAFYSCWQGEKAVMVAERSLVAIVDDEKVVRRAIGRLVMSDGLQFQTFASAEEFLQSSTDASVSCLILDLRLPGMSGLELQQRLAADHNRTPIVFVSAHDDPESRATALGAGAVAFLAKPFKDDVLLQAVRSAMGPIAGK
jgi:FixJ family two-component response regulator